MPLSANEARTRKQWLTTELRQEFSGVAIAVGLSGGQYDFAVRVQGDRDISMAVKSKIQRWLPGSNPDVQFTKRTLAR